MTDDYPMNPAEEMAQEAMEAARSKACATCIYFKRIAADAEEGNCRRHAPVVSASDFGGSVTRWPKVYEADYCGDYVASVLVAYERLMAPLSHRRDATLALTDNHGAALEKAIRAEGFRILLDPETGDVKLERAEERAE